MQSSSRLFPVSLLSAELRAGLSEDVYMLRPRRDPDSSVQLALTRLGSPDTSVFGEPVILLHGSFSNRRFWYSPKGVGIGPYLARKGFDVWLLEMRGHGLSPRNKQYCKNTLTAYVQHDLPAVAEFVMEQTGKRPHWLGHSLGWTTLAGALGGGYLTTEQAASVALFGSQVSRSLWLLKILPLEWLLRFFLSRKTHLSGARLNRGPEDEPIGVILQALRTHGLFGYFGEPKNDWWKGLSAVQVPVLVVAGGDDPMDPEWACQKMYEQFGSAQRHFLSLSRKAGFSQNYGHADMLLSEAAQQEVWPCVERWLRKRKPLDTA